MAVFPSRPYNPNAPSNRVNAILRKYPLLFGGPFIGIIVIASFGLSSFTQTRYDLQKQKTSVMSPEEEKRLESKRRPVDRREEYFVSTSAGPHSSGESGLMYTYNQRLSAEATAKEADDWDV
ncbi:Cytochrome oxidase assembly, partial [Tulasnella sp. 408]